MLITNFDNNKTGKYKEALKMYQEQTGDKSLYIDRNAYWKNGAKDDNLSALRCNEDKDLSEFWRIFNNLK